MGAGRRWAGSDIWGSGGAGYMGRCWWKSGGKGLKVGGLTGGIPG